MTSRSVKVREELIHELLYTLIDRYDIQKRRRSETLSHDKSRHRRDVHPLILYYYKYNQIIETYVSILQKVDEISLYIYIYLLKERISEYYNTHTLSSIS